MEIDEVPPVLRDQLGLDASAGLVQLFNHTQEDWSGQVLSAATERFERRLVEETSKMRVEMAQGFAALRVEMAGQRVELLRWAFVFWVGQLGGTAALLAFMLRDIAR